MTALGSAQPDTGQRSVEEIIIPEQFPGMADSDRIHEAASILKLWDKQVSLPEKSIPYLTEKCIWDLDMCLVILSSWTTF